jgi:hypothetical protein
MPTLWDVLCGLGALTVLFSIGVAGLVVWEMFDAR